MCGMRFSPSMLLQDWIGSNPKLVLAEKEVDGFNGLGSCISSGDRTLDELSSRVYKTYLVLTNLRPLWRSNQRLGIPSSTERGGAKRLLNMDV